MPKLITAAPRSRKRSVARVAVLLAANVWLTLGLAAAQGVPADTMMTVQMETVVITAERAAEALSSATSAVSVLHTSDLRALPSDNLADLIGLFPGIGFVNRDGVGNDPLATVRGFYGGGDVEYLLVLVDGVPINDLETTLVPWENLDLDGIERVEFLRGGSSSLYGDVAIGGVINLVSDPDAQPGYRTRISAGSYDSYSASAFMRERLGDRRFTIGVGANRSDGYRDRGRRNVTTLDASLDVWQRGTTRVGLSTRHEFNRSDDPGPITSPIADIGGALLGGQPASTRLVLPFFRFDHLSSNRHRATVSLKAAPSGRLGLDGWLTGSIRREDEVRTLMLAADFGDTKARQLDTERIAASLQGTWDLGASGRFIAGAESSIGVFRSTYEQVMLGSSEDYNALTQMPAPDPSTDGDGSRLSSGVFGQLEFIPTDRVKLTGGLRYDHIRDRFEDVLPVAERTTTSHKALSPKLGVNVAYVRGEVHRGNLYVTASRSFKAPAADQLFDRRLIPVPFPPFAITIANPELSPQRGVNVEAGLYHRTALIPRALQAEASVSVYRMDMEDELDFDFQTFRLVNIGKSRHDGVETGLRLAHRNGVSGMASYAYQGTTFRNGDFDGNFVKAVPRDLISGAVSYRDRSGVSGSVKLRSAKRIYLDDSNTVPLRDFTTVDAQLAAERGPARVSVSVFNLFDRTYSTTGFQDPAGSTDLFLFPAAGRHATISLTVTG